MIALWLLLFVGLHPCRDQVRGACPERCICLWHIDYTLKINCSGSEKKEVPHGINPQVKILDLSHNEIIVYNHSQTLKSVEEIDLSNNQLTQVSFGSSIRHLESIDLSFNSITEMKKIDVYQLKQLRKLNLSHNSKLYEVSGLKSESLEVLDLSHCYVSYIEDDFLAGIPNIRRVDLSFNEFRTLRNVRSNSLRDLDASHSKIQKLTHLDIYNLPELVKLNVSFVAGLEIDFAYDNSCWSVKNLDLSHSMMTSLNELFPFCSLQVLNASANQIEIIQVRTFFNNCELVFVNLSRNRITEIDERAFFTAEKLKILDLSENRIRDVSFTRHLKQVRELDLSRNRIHTLAGFALNSAEDVNLSANRIAEIRMNLNEVAPALKYLNLSLNKIKHLGRLSSKTVTSIDLSRNAIASIESNAFGNSENLLTVDLTGNKLTILDFRIFEGASALKYLILAGNPWSCRCESNEFKGLYDYVTAHNLTLGPERAAKCERTNVTWKNSCEEAWRREREWRKTVYSLIISLTISSTVVVVVIVCKRFNGKTDGRTARDETSERNDDHLSGGRIQNRVDSFEILSTSTESQQEFPGRNPTPPPNYEAALLLPKPTEREEGSSEIRTSIDCAGRDDRIAENDRPEHA